MTNGKVRPDILAVTGLDDGATLPASWYSDAAPSISRTALSSWAW